MAIEQNYMIHTEISWIHIHIKERRCIFLNNSFLLSGKQKIIYSKLLKIDKKAANIYEGALRVLQMTENPDRFSQAAYSIVELSRILPQKVSTIPIKIENNTRNKKKLEKTEDPLLMADPILTSMFPEIEREIELRRLINFWASLIEGFFKPIAYHFRDTDDLEFIEKLSQFNALLEELLF